MITEFQGPYRFLSNFYPSRVMFEGHVYPCVEHAFVAAKTLDPAKRRTIQNFTTPVMAKRYGKTVELRHDWPTVRLGIMEYLVRQKFDDPTLKKKLLETGDLYIQEGNNWGDTFWGVCKGKGANHLGKILMKVRDEKAS